MGKILGVIAIKGGVGKTTISASLASTLANQYKKKVLLVDANYSAPNLGLHMNIIVPEKSIHHVLDNKIKASSAIQEKFGIDIIPGDYVYNKRLDYLKLKDKLRTLKDKYDFIIVDSSPSMNEEILSTMLASDNLFVVTTPDYPTLSCTLKAAKLAKQRGKPISGLIINKIRSPKYELSLKEIEETTGIPVIARIPDDKTAIKACFSRMPITLYKKNSPFSREITNISSALTRQKKQLPFFRNLLSIPPRKEEINRQFLKKSFYTSPIRR